MKNGLVSDEIQSKKRILLIDIAKGLGMCLVILGHCLPSGRGLLYLSIYAFHMPLFCCLAGLVYKPSTLKIIAGKKFKSLMMPYILFFVTGLIVTLIIPAWGREITVRKILRDLFYGYPATVNVSSIWSFICLFFTILVFTFLVQRMDKKNTIQSVLIFFVLVLFFVLSMLISKFYLSSKLFTWIGRNTYLLLGLQAIFIRVFVVIDNFVFEEDVHLDMLPVAHVIPAFLFVFISSACCVLLINKTIGLARKGKIG